MAVHFNPTRQRYDVFFSKERLISASSRLDSANKYASQQSQAKSEEVFRGAIKSTARTVDLSGELPAIADAVYSISFVELVSMLSRCGISYRDVVILFKNDICYLLPNNRDSDSDNSDGNGGESGVGEAPKRIRRKKMYVLACWVVLLAVVLYLCPIPDAEERRVYTENVLNFVFHLPQLVYDVLKMATDVGDLILLFLKSMYDILEMIIKLLESLEKLRSFKKD